jgi:hypothetical protein
VAQVVVHAHELEQSTSPHAPTPLHWTAHAASLHVTSSHALVPLHVTRHSVLPDPQSTTPHALVALQFTVHLRALVQSIASQTPFARQLIVQS